MLDYLRRNDSAGEIAVERQGEKQRRESHEKISSILETILCKLCTRIPDFLY